MYGGTRQQVAAPGPATAWHGWARRGRGHWRRLTTASTADEALALLRQETHDWPHVDLCVLAEGRLPGGGH